MQEARSTSSDDAAFYNEAASVLAQANDDIRSALRQINSDMNSRERSFEEALILEQAERDKQFGLYDENETFSVLYLPDPIEPPGLPSVSAVAAAVSPKRRNNSNNSNNNDDDDEDGQEEQREDHNNNDNNNNEAEDNNNNEDDDDDTAEQYGYDDDGNKIAFSAAPKQPKPQDKLKNDKVDAKVPDRPLDDSWRVEAVLARKSKNGRLFYRCKWLGRNVVTWELDSRIENRNAVKLYEQQRFAAAHMAARQGSKRLRPAVYVSQKKLERLAKKDAEAASRLRQQLETQQLLAAGVDDNVVWSCEVEPNIFVPYDPESSKALEMAWRLKQPTASITVNGMVFAVDLARMQQMRAGGGTRRVQRTVMQPVEVVRQQIDRMDLTQLRSYIQANAANLGDAALFEALSRLSELDRAVPLGMGSDAAKALPKISFIELMESIANGAEYPGFGNECCICLEDLTPDAVLTVLPTCRHACFHYNCLVDFLTKFSKCCPMCKQAI